MLVLLAALTSAAPSKAESAADNYPARPIRLVVPLSPGTTTDIVARTFATFVPPAFLLGQIQKGKLLALAVTSKEGISTPFKAPSVNETAIPGYEYNTWFGFLAPAGIPKPVLEKLAKALETIAREPAIKERLEAIGVTPRSRILGDFQAYIKADVEKQALIVKSAGLAPH